MTELPDVLECPKCIEILPIDCFARSFKPPFNGVPNFIGCKVKGARAKYMCKKCKAQYSHDYYAARPGLYTHQKHKYGKSKPMKESRNCTTWLGVYVAESLIGKYFKKIKRMPFRNPGYDFICKNGFKIDVKSSCLITRESYYATTRVWQFAIQHNKIADYFVLLAFDNRDDLNLMRFWIVPSSDISDKGWVCISNSEVAIAKWLQYEKPIDKLQNVCNLMKEKGVV